ncbi:hypothetical protein F4810DRAFT_720241 [Camillea tinctor]|nr:hypothetical protein F4810DRAFT_720241 [Camillea tinctor]
MSYPLPVPSKAAIRALRGIAFGTSCAIGVIVEDRRRRISTLRTAVSNHKKLKSSRKYHGTLESVSSKSDDSVVYRPDELQSQQTPDSLGNAQHPHQQQHRGNESPYLGSQARAACPDNREPTHQEGLARPTEPTRLQTTSTPSPSRASAEPRVTPPQKASQWSSSSPPSMHGPVQSVSRMWGTQQPPAPKVSTPKPAVPSNNAIMQVLDGDDENKLNKAISMFRDVARINPSGLLSRPWLKVSARLSKECQASGRMGDASQILLTVINAGPLNEQQYYVHHPLPLISFHLQPPNENTRCSLEAIVMAYRLLMAKFVEKPRSHAAEVESLGKQLITQMLLLKKATAAMKVYWLVLSRLKSAPAAEFVEWAIQELYHYGDYKNVIKCFLLNYSKMKPKEGCFNRTVNYVVEAVRAMNGSKVRLVLRAFKEMECPQKGALRSLWVMKLLLAHWQRKQDFAQSQELFDEIASIGLLDKIFYPEGVYRTMAEIALKAGEEDIVRFYYEEITRKYPYMVWDISLNGYMAVLEAKKGNWIAVHEAFEDMCRRVGNRQQEYDDVFVMILDVFSKDHPIADIRGLVEKYTSELGVRMHRYIVTLVASKYGEGHDTEGFISWLQYCGKAGYGMDSSFCNSILWNSQSIWKLSFPDLQRLYLEMERINRSFPDDSTHRIMSQAERLSKPYRRATGHRIRPRVVRINRLAYLGRTTSTRDIYEAMYHEVRRGRPTASIKIFSRAKRFGMPFCRHCLRLAVYAALNKRISAPNQALLLIRNAHEQGHYVGSAVATFIKIQIDRLQSSPEDVLLHMRNITNSFEAIHIEIEPSVMTHMAIVCVKIGQLEKAIALCRLAMDKRGESNQCFSRQSFRALLMAYLQTWNAEGLHGLLQDLAESRFADDRTVLSHLKGARRHLAKIRRDDARIFLQDIVQRGVEMVRERRAQKLREGKLISQTTLQIMGEALKDLQNGNDDDDDGGNEDKEMDGFREESDGDETWSNADGFSRDKRDQRSDPDTVGLPPTKHVPTPVQRSLTAVF